MIFGRFTLTSFCFISLFAIPVFAQSPVGFEDAMEMFYKTPIYQSFEKDIVAIRLDFESRDLVLQPTLELSGSRSRDDRRYLFRPPTIPPETTLINLSLDKSFSTGTNLTVTSSFQNLSTPTISPGEQTLTNWQVVFSQSLWRDGFGRATDLRHSREDYEQKWQLANTLRARAQSILEFENLYWDWALTLKEIELQKKNLKRAEEILRWIKDRLKRSAAEKTDYLNAQALLVRRELQVTALQQRVTQALLQVERFLPMASVIPNSKDLSVMRSIDGLASPWVNEELEAEVLPLDFLAIANEAETQTLRAKEVRETIRPEFNLEAVYAKNAIDPSDSEALQRMFSDSNEYSSIGVVFRTGLDLSREKKQVQSAKSRAEALTERKDAMEKQAKIAWDQLRKELSDLKDQIARAEDLVKVQTQKAEAEKARYRRGRSTAFEAITYEQEVVEAEILLWTLYSTMRKTEARARLFARTNESH